MNQSHRASPPQRRSRFAKLIADIRLGVRTLWMHKLRSALTMLGVVFGVGAVIAMLAVGEGASKVALDQIKKLGSQNIMISSQEPAQQASGGRRQRLSIYGLHFDDVDRINQSLHTVTKVVPAKVMPKEARVGTQTLDIRVVGTTSGWFELVQRDVIAGRVLTEQDETRRSNIVVLTEHGARKLLATRDALGTPVRIGGASFTVVGIVQSETVGAGGVQTPDRNVDAYMPMSVARERFGDIVVERGAGSRSRELVELHQIIVQVGEREQVEDTAVAIERMMQTFHPKGDYAVEVPLALLRQAQSTRRTFNIVLGSIAGISLLIGGIGIMNIMLASVTERTREIGVRRAIGARKSQIIAQFLIESVVLSATGGAIGVCLGLAIPQLVTLVAGMPTVVTLWSVLLAAGISVLVGVVFGVFPAVRAANLDPIVALRQQ